VGWALGLGVGVRVPQYLRCHSIIRVQQEHQQSMQQPFHPHLAQQTPISQPS
jgi:hypothetical protein